MRRRTIDADDIRVLKMLQKDGKAKNQDIANQIGVVQSTISKKIRWLEGSGVIKGYRCVLNTGPEFDLNKIQHIEFIILHVHNHDTASTAEFEQAVLAFPEVAEMHTIKGGGGDYLIKATCRNAHGSHLLMRRLQSVNNFKHMSSMTVVHTISDRGPNVDLAFGNGGERETDDAD